MMEKSKAVPTESSGISTFAESHRSRREADLDLTGRRLALTPGKEDCRHGGSGTEANLDHLRVEGDFHLLNEGQTLRL